MLYELLKNGYADGKDLNCAEQILYGANEAYNLEIDKNGLKLSAAFGGGMAIEDKCGAITGAIMVLGRLYVVDRAHESDRIKNLTMEMFSTYEQQMKSIDCKPLKSMYRNDEIKCSKVVLAAAEILDDIIEREGLLD